MLRFPWRMFTPNAPVPAATYLTPAIAAIVVGLLPEFLLETPVSVMAATIITGHAQRFAAETRIAVSRKVACEMLGVGSSRLIALERSGELLSYLDGASRKIVISSVYARLIRLALNAHPVGGAPATVRHPLGEYRKAPRARTPQELAGLRRSNERRAEEGRQRRAARAQAREARKGAPAL